MGPDTKCPIHGNSHPDFLCPDKKADAEEGDPVASKKVVSKYTFGELKEKARLALATPRLIEIVKSAPLNDSGARKGEVNLNWVEREAFQYVLEETGNPKRAHELARSAYYLAMMRRDYKDEFNMLLSSMRLVPKGELVEVEIYAASPSSLEFPKERRWKLVFPDRWIFLYFCNQLINHELSELLGNNSAEGASLDIRNAMIQLLEEKFGMKVRICGNCKFFKVQKALGEYNIWCSYIDGANAYKSVRGNQTCVNNRLNGVINRWEPILRETKDDAAKEVSE